MPAQPSLRYTFDRSVRFTDSGRVLIGGSPLRILRLSERGAALAGELRRSEAHDPLPPASARLVERLVTIGALHPRPQPRAPRPGELTVVIPAFNDDSALATTLAALARTAPGTPVVVVDDGGSNPDHTAAIAQSGGATVLRHGFNRGPAAARNTGLAEVSSPLVVFVDAGCQPQHGWLGPLLALLDLDGVALVAPRIVGRCEDRSVTARYEAARSPLDRGDEPGPVRPNTRIPYVPAACLAGRVEALREAGGFPEELRVGEDVDLVWRLAEDGSTVRYEPASRVAHDHRTCLVELLRRRFAYGTSAASLHRRHSGSVRPLGVSAWSVALWAALAAGKPRVATALAAGTTGALSRRLGALEHPLAEAARLAGSGNVMAGRAIADALVRAWWPLTLLIACTSRRARRAGLAAVTIPALVEWIRLRPELDPLRWTVLRAADDVAYATGVWDGCIRQHTIGPLVPDLSNWPGRRSAVVAAPGERA